MEQVVKVIWHKAASPPLTDGSIVFARYRQCAPLSITPYRHQRCTGSTPYWVALSMSTAGHAMQAGPGPAPFRPQTIVLSRVGILTPSNTWHDPIWYMVP